MNNKNFKYNQLIAVRTISKVIIFAVSLSLITGCASKSQSRYLVQTPKVKPAPTKEIKDIGVALVLGSGGFRGSAHIGVLEVLEEHNIPIHLIVGSSAGSFVGAMYADDPDAKKLREKLFSLEKDDVIDTSISGIIKAPFVLSTPIKGIALQRYLLNNLTAKNFGDLKIPLVAVTTDLLKNKLDVIRSGPLVPAIHASSAMPPLFTPVDLYEGLHIDGGVLAPVPVGVAKSFKPKITIAVDITKVPETVSPRNAFDLANRAIDVSFSKFARSQSNLADIVIRPKMPYSKAFDNKFKFDFYIAGREAALEVIEKIKSML